MREDGGPSQGVDVRTVIDGAGFSGLQRLIFGLCFCIALIDGFDTAAIGYVAPSLMAEWGVARPALGPVLSAALVGLAFGAIAAGPLADRFGRRAMLIAATIEIGLASLAAAFAADLGQLVVLRFVGGLGLGAVMPNAVTLTNEYCPSRHRALLTNLMFCGFPLGVALGGFLGAWMIPHLGWRSVFVLGGIAPLLLVPVLVAALPESLSYLVAKGAPAARIHAILARIAPDQARAGRPVLRREGAARGRGGIGLVLSPSYRLGSAMLWLAYFMGLVIFYALVNWMPILLRDGGLDARSAALITALFPLGGLGAVALGVLMDRFHATAIVAAAFAATALAVAAIGQVQGHLAALIPCVLVAGILMNTAQSSLPALAAGFYPTEGRATGVAWMLGIGRFGGVAGSFLVAELSARALALPAIFTIVAVPALIAAIALFVKAKADRSGGPQVPALAVPAP